MSAWEPSVGASDEWYTPARVFHALGTVFDLDVAAPAGGAPHVPCRRYLTKADDGLTAPWSGCVWMNPPFGGAQRTGALAAPLLRPWQRNRPDARPDLRPVVAGRGGPCRGHPVHTRQGPVRAARWGGRQVARHRHDALGDWGGDCRRSLGGASLWPRNCVGARMTRPSTSSGMSPDTGDRCGGPVKLAGNRRRDDRSHASDARSFPTETPRGCGLGAFSGGRG